ncbi:MAG: endolytic transglycosylase MltG [Candidatus Margulisiibacteriota bacterium]
MKNLKLIAIVTFAVLLIFGAFSLLSLLLSIGSNTRPVKVEIKPGSSASLIARDLAGQKVIKSARDFKLIASLLGSSNKFQAGLYKFKARTPLYEVVLKLKTGSIMAPEPLTVTFPEGTSIYKMGSILEKASMLDFENFRKLTREEGYLYPDTYIFDKEITAEALANLMRKRFNDVVLPYWEQNKKATKYDLRRIIILASIIEKEAAQDGERPIISSVFHNRLDIKMALDSCSTVKYALEKPTKVVYFDQLKYPSPYNTYLHRGLPPGPICNPGLASIKAAIYPAKTNYLYFIANKDGSHSFSATWAEHQKARVKVSTPTR